MGMLTIYLGLATAGHHYPRRTLPSEKCIKPSLIRRFVSLKFFSLFSHLRCSDSTAARLFGERYD